jgi:hypothetical protein
LHCHSATSSSKTNRQKQPPLFPQQHYNPVLFINSFPILVMAEIKCLLVGLPTCLSTLILVLFFDRRSRCFAPSARFSSLSSVTIVAF